MAPVPSDFPPMWHFVRAARNCPLKASQMHPTLWKQIRAACRRWFMGQRNGIILKTNINFLIKDCVPIDIFFLHSPSSSSWASGLRSILRLSAGLLMCQPKTHHQPTPLRCRHTIMTNTKILTTTVLNHPPKKQNLPIHLFQYLTHSWRAGVESWVSKCSH